MQLKYYLQVFKDGRMILHKSVLSFTVDESTIKLTKEQYDFMKSAGLKCVEVDSAYLIG